MLLIESSTSIDNKAIVILSLYGFIQQIFLIKKQKSIGTFSLFVPAIIIITSLLKIFFWFIQPYAFSIFIQSFLLITIQLVLLKVCINVRKYENPKNNSYLLNFWNWEHLTQYIIFLISLSIFLAILTYLSVQFEIPVIGHIFGYISTIIEVYLAIPQLYSSYKNKSVEGVSKIMIGMWIINDSLKTGYFIYNSQPIQFILTGSIQILLDLALITQMIIYRKGNKVLSQKDL